MPNQTEVTLIALLDTLTSVNWVSLPLFGDDVHFDISVHLTY